jgi:hypothetical protein
METDSLPNRCRWGARVRAMADSSGAHDPTIRALPDGAAPEPQRLAEPGGKPVADRFRRTADIGRVLEYMAKLRGRGGF